MRETERREIEREGERRVRERDHIRDILKKMKE